MVTAGRNITYQGNTITDNTPGLWVNQLTIVQCGK
jgi:hypothetical protein